MENVSQVILRNAARMKGANVLVADPAPDNLFRELESCCETVRLSTTSFSVYRRLQAMGAGIDFAPCPVSETPVDCLVMVQPKEKEKLAMNLHAASECLAPGGRLWLVGENRAGIKSSPATLKRFFGQVEKLDSARHCGLFENAEPLEGPGFRLDDYESRWKLRRAGGELSLHTLPGVFAHGRLDQGTDLLLGVLENLVPSGRVLDFGSGCGVIGLSILAAGGGPELVLLDDSALAIESGRRSLEANGRHAESLPSDGLSEAKGRFDWIVSNPPFHRGVRNDLDVAEAFFREAGTFLRKNGKILVVFNRHLPYTGWLRKSFNRVDCLAQNRAFTVIQASKKK